MAGGKFIGWVADKIPTIFNYFKDRKRINEVNKIENAISSGDDVVVNDELHKIRTKEENRRKANL